MHRSLDRFGPHGDVIPYSCMDAITFPGEIPQGKYLVIRIYCLTKSLRLLVLALLRFACSVLRLSVARSIVWACSLLRCLDVLVVSLIQSIFDLLILLLSLYAHPFMHSPATTYLERERRGTSSKTPRLRKASSFPLGEVTGAVEKRGAHPTTRHCGRPSAVERAHRAATEAPGAPTLSCSSIRVGWQAERFDPGNVIPRYPG